jgi:hypothetical protein
MRSTKKSSKRKQREIAPRGAKPPSDPPRDELVNPRQTRKELGGVSRMTILRWEKDAALGFPPAIRINNQKYRSRNQLDAFKQRMGLP